MPTEAKEEKLYYDQRSIALRTTQSVTFVEEHDKMYLLELILNEYKETQTVIVVKSKKKADAIAKLLLSLEFKVTAIHGNHREEQQQKASEAFNLGSLTVLVTTDMILKKMALEKVELLFSYDLPELPMSYYERLALMKEKGVAVALVNREDEVFLGEIEHNMKAEIEEKKVEGFEATAKPKTTNKKNRTKKPRHTKKKNHQSY